MSDLENIVDELETENANLQDEVDELKTRVEELEGALITIRRELMADLPENAIDLIDEILKEGGRE